MARRSLDSETTMMAPMATPARVSSAKRISMINTASPSFSTLDTSATSTTIANAGIAEIKYLSDGFDRLENKHLQSQRFVLNEQKRDDMSKASLGAKVQRALDRRMTNQDAVFRVKKNVTSTLSKASSLNSLTTTLFDEKKSYTQKGDMIRV